MNFSAAKLLKQSAMQIVYLRLNEQEDTPNQAQLDGVKSQEENSANGSQYLEMRGTYPINEADRIHFSFDEVIDGDTQQYIEHKMISEGTKLEAWYFQYCCIQVAFYQSMLSELVAMDKYKQYTLQTASFRVREGYAKVFLNVAKKREFILQFNHVGGKSDRYRITVNNPKQIVQFYTTKAEYCYNYKMAKAFDALNKHREWKKLGHYIEVEEL